MWSVEVFVELINEDGHTETPGDDVDFALVVSVEFDCNTNGIVDSEDVARGTSADTNDNGIPDECEIQCNNDGDCDDTDDCTLDTCVPLDPQAGPDGCLHDYQSRVFADIKAAFCPPSCPQPDLDDVLCVLDDFADGPGVNGCGDNVYSTDLAPCGGDGIIGLDNVLYMLDAFAGIYNCPHCPCGTGIGESAPEGGGGSSSPERDRSAEFGNALLIFLTTRAPADGPYEDRFATAVDVLTSWVVAHMNCDQRAELAEQLQDPSQEFASPVAEAMVSQIVTRLLDE